MTPDGRSATLGFTSSFGGTSSAAPLAAGVCALMLSANPNLTLSAIGQILRNSADKIGSGYDANGHSNHYGYGRINALRAVQQAQAWGQNLGTTTPSTPTTPTPSTPTETGSVQRGVVLSTTLSIRNGPSTSYTKISSLNKGDEVYLLEKPAVGGVLAMAPMCMAITFACNRPTEKAK
ncbi:MAG: S8 family serine peptidase [Lewinellaceae bacterium]|nr:S8 family serine peptidase [Lewinellaceae bacterium]